MAVAQLCRKSGRSQGQVIGRRAVRNPSSSATGLPPLGASLTTPINRKACFQWLHYCRHAIKFHALARPYNEPYIRYLAIANFYSR